MDEANSPRSLFDNVQNEQPTPKHPSQWLFVTNHMNLCYILSAGLILPPGGFRKYYQDPLSIAPGWIPVYADSLPQEALDIATRERKTLRPCVMVLDLSSLGNGRVMGVDPKGDLVEVDIARAREGGFRMIYISAPLPLTTVKVIAFNTKEDMAAFQEVASDFNNIPIKEFNIKAVKKYFKINNIFPDIPIPDINAAHDAPTNRVQAIGGITAMLANIADIGNLAMATYKYALEPNGEPPPFIEDLRLKALGTWIKGDIEEIEKSKSVRLFWKVIDVLVESQTDARSHEYLEKIQDLLAEFAEANSSESLKTLAHDLFQLSGFADQTLTEIFEKHNTPSSRALALLFSGIRTTEFFEFQHPLFLEPERVFAAILFGARDGWQALPLLIRDIPNLEDYVSYQMARFSHDKLNSVLNLGDPPVRPVSLRELLTPDGDKGWTTEQKEAALLIARKKKWDCLETHIKLPKGDYPIKIDGSGVHIVLQGDVPVDTKVRQKNFFEKLGTDRISKRLESEVRSLFRGR